MKRFTKASAVGHVAGRIASRLVSGADEHAGIVEAVKQREAVPPLMDGLTQKFEIVGLVRFLLSDATKYITGQTYFLRTPK